MKNKNIIAVCNLIRCLDIKSLRNSEVVANLIRAFGIVQWSSPGVFGDDEIFKNATEDMAGIYQTPDQTGKALVYLSQFEIKSYIEIGVFQGGNFLFMSEYLRRFNPEILCTGIDPTGFLNPEIRDIIETDLRLSHKHLTSDDIKGQAFDLCFIDGDHTAEWVRKDWENVGRFAKICMIHDIQETTCPEIVEFWNERRKHDSLTFLDYTSDKPSMLFSLYGSLLHLNPIH